MFHHHPCLLVQRLQKLSSGSPHRIVDCRCFCLRKRCDFPRSYNPSFKHEKYHASPGPSPTMDASQSVQLQFDLELGLIMFDKPVEIQETCFAWSRTVFVLALGAFGSWIAHPCPSYLLQSTIHKNFGWGQPSACFLQHGGRNLSGGEIQCDERVQNYATLSIFGQARVPSHDCINLLLSNLFSSLITTVLDSWLQEFSRGAPISHRTRTQAWGSKWDTMWIWMRFEGYKLSQHGHFESYS